MSFSYDTIWPMKLDMSESECREILREKELLCYADVLSVLRAQGPLSDDKKSLLMMLKKVFSISDDRSKAEYRRVASSEKLSTIAECISGCDAYSEWAALGAMKFPPTIRPSARTIYCDQASQTSQIQANKEKNYPEPNETANLDLSEKHNTAINSNRYTNKDKHLKSEMVNKSSLTSDLNKTNQDLYKNTKIKDTSSSHDYNLHLLSEIATGESNQSDQLNEQSAAVNVSANIKPDSFSIRHQINDIEEQSANAEVVISNPQIVNKSNANTSIILSTNSNVGNPINIQSTGNLPMVTQRIVLPRGTANAGINLITANQAKSQGQNHPIASFISHPNPHQQPGSGNTFLTLTNNQLRSPQTISWNTQQQVSSQPVYISNLASHSSADNFSTLGLTLQNRARNEQSTNKSNLIVRNLGNQANIEPERNKRYMLLKGGNTGSSMGPSSKKSKISNPSNRQPGRPPLMPAPSSAYANRPYVANEIFTTNRGNSGSGSSHLDSMDNSNSNSGVRISSVSSRAGNASGNSSTNLISGSMNNSSYNSSSLNSTTSSQLHKTNSGGGSAAPNYLSINRTNQASSSSRLQSTTSLAASTGSNSINRSLVSSNAADVISNALSTPKQKSVQPVISVVPLSPVTLASTINTSSQIQQSQAIISSNPSSGLTTSSISALPVTVSSNESATYISSNIGNYRRFTTSSTSSLAAVSSSISNINPSNMITSTIQSVNLPIDCSNTHPNITSIGTNKITLINRDSMNINTFLITQSNMENPTPATLAVNQGDNNNKQ